MKAIQIDVPIQATGAISDLQEGWGGYIRTMAATGWLVDPEGNVWIEGRKDYMDHRVDRWCHPIIRRGGKLILLDGLPKDAMPLLYQDMTWPIAALGAERVYENEPPKRRPWWRFWR
jgi:hypothetical protein